MKTPYYTDLSPPHGSEVSINWKNKDIPTKTPVFFPKKVEEYFGTPTVQQHLYHGENLEILGHLLETQKNSFDLIYADPPFDSVAEYKKSISPLGNKNFKFYQEQYNDIWSQGEYEQFLFVRFMIFRELLNQEGTLYVHCDWHAAHIIRLILDEVFGRENFRNEIIWHHDFGGRGKRFLARKHDNIFLYTKSKKWYFDHTSLPDLPYQGKLHKYRGTEKKGKKPTAVWSDIAHDEVWDIAYENKMSQKNTGYPTQKPQELLKRLIRLSCPPNGKILDPFIGSGTTMRVAQLLGRRCIGIDANKDAIETTRNSLLQQFPNTSLNVHSLHEHYSHCSEHLARKSICEQYQYKKTTSEVTTSSSNDLILFAPLTRTCTSLDIKRIISRYQTEINSHKQCYLWGFSFDFCRESTDTLPKSFVIKEIECKPSFSIQWELREDRIIIQDVCLPKLRDRLGCDDTIHWQQLVSSIRIQHKESADSIHIGTAKKWVPNEIIVDTLPCVITITDILSRSVSITISSNP